MLALLSARRAKEDGISESQGKLTLVVFRC